MPVLGLNLSAIDRFITKNLNSISDEEVGGYIRGAVIAVYNQAIPNVPQYSGHMAANLTVNIDGVESPGADIRYTGYVHFGQDQVYEAGHPFGVTASRARNNWVNSAALTIHSRGFLYYANEPDEGYYTAVEDGTADLRDVNLPSRALYDAGLYAKAAFRYTKQYRATLKWMRI